MTTGPKTRVSRPRARKPGKNGVRSTVSSAKEEEKKGAKNGSHRREELAREVVEELKTLRAALDVMTDHYRLNAGAQITELLQNAEGEVNLGSRAKLPPASIMQQQLERLRDARLKPRKGRGKDFVRLQNLLEELVAAMPAED